LDLEENFRSILPLTTGVHEYSTSTLFLYLLFSVRQHICLARYMLSPVRPSVCQTDGS